MALAISLKPKRDDEEEFVLFPEAARSAHHGASGGKETRGLAEHEEGRLAVDVYETDGELVIKTAIAAVELENLEVFVHNDMLTIRGKRHDDETVERGRTIVRECHWGAFSRSVILPVEVDADRVAATLKNGVLTIRMPKMERSKRISVKGI
jgi:HSP20 family protein